MQHADCAVHFTPGDMPRWLESHNESRVPSLQFMMRVFDFAMLLNTSWVAQRRMVCMAEPSIFCYPHQN